MSRLLGVSTWWSWGPSWWGLQSARALCAWWKRLIHNFTHAKSGTTASRKNGLTSRIIRMCQRCFFPHYTSRVSLLQVRWMQGLQHSNEPQACVQSPRVRDGHASVVSTGLRPTLSISPPIQSQRRCFSLLDLVAFAFAVWQLKTINNRLKEGEDRRSTSEWLVANLVAWEEKSQFVWTLMKTIGNRKRDLCVRWLGVINLTWENLQIAKHKSVRWTERTPSWFVLCDR